MEKLFAESALIARGFGAKNSHGLWRKGGRYFAPHIAPCLGPAAKRQKAEQEVITTTFQGKDPKQEVNAEAKEEHEVIAPTSKQEAKEEHDGITPISKEETKEDHEGIRPTLKEETKEEHERITPTLSEEAKEEHEGITLNDEANEEQEETSPTSVVS